MILFLICLLLWLNAACVRSRNSPPKQLCLPPVLDAEIDEDPQVELDIEHYKRQLDLYYEQLWEAEDYLERAREAIKLDRELNKYGAVVKDKAYEQHRKDYQKWLGKVATINNKIYTTERRLNKCTSK